MANFPANALLTATGLSLLGCAGFAAADPIVLQDQGPTTSIDRYGIPAIALPRQPVPLPAQGGNLPAPAPAYPVETPGLSPGAFAPFTVNLPQLAGRPLFIVGSDESSRNWLARHQGRLAQINAAGLLVQAQGPDDYNAMKSLAGALPLAAVNAQELAKTLGLSHYPALVSSGRVEQ